MQDITVSEIVGVLGELVGGSVACMRTGCAGIGRRRRRQFAARPGARRCREVRQIERRAELARPGSGCIGHRGRRLGRGRAGAERARRARRAGIGVGSKASPRRLAGGARLRHGRRRRRRRGSDNRRGGGSAAANIVPSAVAAPLRRRGRAALHLRLQTLYLLLELLVAVLQLLHRAGESRGASLRGDRCASPGRHAESCARAASAANAHAKTPRAGERSGSSPATYSVDSSVYHSPPYVQIVTFGHISGDGFTPIRCLGQRGSKASPVALSAKAYRRALRRATSSD